MTAHFSSRVTNFEFVKNVRESGFTFKSYKEKVDLSRIAHLDLDRVARDLDVSVLQEHISTLINCDLGDLKGIDPGLVKLLHLAQLCLDYCLYCQDFLSGSLTSLENVHVETLQESDVLRKENKNLKERLKKGNKKKKLLSEHKENLLTTYYECEQCKKGYSSQDYLESHKQRRHSSDLGDNGNSKDMLLELKKEIEALREELHREKIDTNQSTLDNHQEIQLKREEALWADIEKTQSDQRARHQTEIADLTAHFQTQLKQALADLATNLSSNVPQQNLNNDVSIDAASNYQARDVELLKTEISSVWHTKFEQQENWFKFENSKLLEQLQLMQKKEEQRWSELQKMQQEGQFLVPKKTTSPEAPVPATRRKKLMRQLQSTESVSEFRFPVNQTTIPSAPTIEDVSDFFESSESSISEHKEPVVAQNFVVCVPKIVHSRPKSAASSIPSQSRESLSDEEETTEKSEDIDATLKDMKEAIEQNPVLMESLKNEVLCQVEEKMAEVGLGSEERLSRREFSAVGGHLKEQRKSAEKQYHGFWKLRRSIEKKVDKKVKEAKPEIIEVSNVKPSKVKQHTGFFSKLTKRYGSKKEAMSQSETQIFTSTPMKQAPLGEEPHSILKQVAENTRHSVQDIPLKETPLQTSDLKRAQSLPSNKFVSFVSENKEEDKENSWDETFSQAKETKSLAEGSSYSGWGKANPFVASKFTQKENKPIEELNYDIDDLEKELANFQSSSFGNLSSKPDSIKATKSDSSKHLSDDNSWDLEDI